VTKVWRCERFRCVAKAKYWKGCGLSIRHSQPGTESLELWLPQRRAGKCCDQWQTAVLLCSSKCWRAYRYIWYVLYYVHRRMSFWSRPKVLNRVRIETGFKSQARIPIEFKYQAGFW